MADVEHAPLSVSLYFTAEWWDRHFHADRPRPEARSWAALERMYLGRQRFLFERFGDRGLGQERPEPGGQLATVIRHGFDLVPVLLGTRLDFSDAWGFYPRFRTLDEAMDVPPADLAAAPEGRWILREAERLRGRYGSCGQCLDIASVVNNAFRVIGQEVYTEALARPAELRRLLDTVLATMEAAYRFVRSVFGGMTPVPVGNCNASLLGPATYAEVFLPYDAAQCRFGGVGSCAMHHCDVRAEPFLAAYAGLPGVASLQASFDSDPAAIRETLRGAAFSAIVSPPALDGDLGELRARLHRAVAGGAADLAVWNVDARTSPERIGAVCAIVTEAAGAVGRRAVFSGMPLCWEELEWAHARYRPEGWSRDFA